MQVVATGGLDRRDRRPAHAEVALDRAGDRRGGDDLAGQAAVLGVELDDAVHVGGRAADVDDDDVTGPAVLVVEAAGEQLDAGQHDVGRRAAHHRGEGAAAGVGAAAEVLAADDVAQEDLADRPARAVGGEHADARHDVVGEHVRRPRAGRAAPRPGAATRRCRPPRRAPATAARPGSRASPSSTSALPPSVPPTSSTTSGSAARSSASLASSSPPCEHQHDLAAAGERDPAAGLGGDQLLVADDRDAQPAAGAGAGEHVGVDRARVLLGERGHAGVVPVEDVTGAGRVRERGRVARGGEQVAGRRGRPARPW